MLKSRFSQTYQQAVAGKLDDWQEQPLSCLALIIVFDRFPHRNQILGRENTPTETEFLKQPGSGF